MYPYPVRTTLDIDDSVLDAARAIAQAEGSSLGAVISELARRGLVPARRDETGFPTFDVPRDAGPITPDMVRQALDE
jgi:hypothetical protein